jgi:hypothetical protein
MFRPMIVAALVVGVAACASEPPRRDLRHRGGPPGEARVRRGLFISPSGEPFRGEDGLGAWFAQTDANHDGAITLAEFQADAERFFHQLDTNQDGVIDGGEVTAYERSVAPEITGFDGGQPPAQSGQGQRGGGGGGGGMGGGGRRGGGMGGGGMGGGGMGGGGMGGGGMGGRGGGGGGGGGSGSTSSSAPASNPLEGAARFSLINEPEPVANADENLDSHITLAEWRHATARRFAVIDKPKTGRLTLDELRDKVPKPRR